MIPEVLGLSQAGRTEGGQTTPERLLLTTISSVSESRACTGSKTGANVQEEVHASNIEAECPAEPAGLLRELLGSAESVTDSREQ